MGTLEIPEPEPSFLASLRVMMPWSNSAPWRAGVAEQKEWPCKKCLVHVVSKYALVFFHPYPGQDSQFIPFTRWWFQNMLFLFFTPKILGGRWTQFDLSIFFQMGWFNHQPDMLHPGKLTWVPIDSFVWAIYGVDPSKMPKKVRFWSSEFAHRSPPGKLSWNPKMEVWFRWFSVSIGWFLGSMSNSRGLHWKNL